MERQEKNTGVYFTSLKLENVRCFGTNSLLDLGDENGNWRKWNLILGNNGTGKTTLLRCISGMSFMRTKYEDAHSRNFGLKFSEDFLFFSLFPLKKANAFRRKSAITAAYQRVDGETSSATYDQEFANDFVGPLFGFEHPYNLRFEYMFTLGYGANRFTSFNKFSDQKSEVSDTLFDDDAKLINAEEWLLSMDYAASRESELKTFAEHRKNLIIEVLTEILPGINEVRFTTPTKEALVPQVEFKTEFGWTGIHQLSLGYKTMVAWIVDVAARMFERYPDSDNPLAEPVVILVDEIDLHLHPKWQRKIFDFLTEKFPRAQFIVTAHSPLVVQSAPKDANIIVLRQTVDEQGNAYVKIDNDQESVRTWRLDQILSSDLFGLESSRNPEVAEQLEERTKLLQKEKLTAKEKKRLKELNGLADALPTASSPADIKAMELIRKAAKLFEEKGLSQ